MSNWEYKLERGTKEVIQTKLNQWRHKYEIKVESIVAVVGSVPLEIIAVIKRKETSPDDIPFTF